MNIDIDGAPLLSHLPGHPRVVMAATANGYTLGPLVGREAARGALSGRMRPDLAEFDLSRFQMSPRKEHA
jgi:glycine/D-amino acid oxidase-like deaminating enzyme